MDIIYEPTGRAKEYADLAINIYKGCTHGCKYCYGAKLPWLQSQGYYESAKPKGNIIERVKKDASKLDSNCPEILLSFTGDVYQPEEMNLGLTRQVIETLIDHNLPFTILTKGGTRAARDFDLLEKYDKARFGSTLVFWNQKDADEWEPNVPSIADRIDAIVEANTLGIPTWVSLEPVINPDQAMAIVSELHPFVDHWKVGKLNYKSLKVNWIKFREEIKRLFNYLKADYSIKHSLLNLREP